MSRSRWHSTAAGPSVRANRTRRKNWASSSGTDESGNLDDALDCYRRYGVPKGTLHSVAAPSRGLDAPRGVGLSVGATFLLEYARAHQNVPNPDTMNLIRAGELAGRVSF